VVLSSRLIDGQFPNYRQLLPETFEHELRLADSRQHVGSVRMIRQSDALHDAWEFADAMPTREGP